MAFSCILVSIPRSSSRLAFPAYAAYASTSMSDSDETFTVIPMLDVFGWGTTTVSPMVGVTPGAIVNMAEWLTMSRRGCTSFGVTSLRR
jgi:hypothetical protein